jgi:hypothetical protein
MGCDAMISLSEERLAAARSQFFPNLDDPGPYDAGAHLGPDASPWHIAPVARGAREGQTNARALGVSSRG